MVVMMMMMMIMIKDLSCQKLSPSLPVGMSIFLSIVFADIFVYIYVLSQVIWILHL